MGEIGVWRDTVACSLHVHMFLMKEVSIISAASAELGWQSCLVVHDILCSDGNVLVLRMTSHVCQRHWWKITV